MSHNLLKLHQILSLLHTHIIIIKKLIIIHLLIICKIIEKSLYHVTIDKSKNKIKRSNSLINEYRNFYTEIKFDQDIRYKQSYIDFKQPIILRAN